MFWSPRYFDVQNAILAIEGVEGLTCDQAPSIAGLKEPTHFQQNAVTEAFQWMVDMYGVPSYREINPAIFAIVSFPFFFGVMFGDIMHGLMVLAFGAYLIFAHSNPNSFAHKLAEIRYFVFFMGFFSTYCGLVYNDFTALVT